MRYALVVVLASMTTVSACGPSRTRTVTSQADAEPPRRAERALHIVTGRMAPLDARRFVVDVPELRATTHRCGATHAELDFAYHGATDSAVALASGEVRRQLGLKLRAKDTCNVVYVMWRLEPDSGIYVSIKRNPGESMHTSCGAHGYVNLSPSASTAPPRVRPGEQHTLRAVIDGDELRILADERLAWEGALPKTLLDFDGPTGIRSDNVRYDFELRDDGRVAPDCSEN